MLSFLQHTTTSPLTLACLGVLQNMCDFGALNSSLAASVQNALCEEKSGAVQVLTDLVKAKKKADGIDVAVLECVRNVLFNHTLNKDAACECGLGVSLIRTLREETAHIKQSAKKSQRKMLAVLRCLVNYAGL